MNSLLKIKIPLDSHSLDEIEIFFDYLELRAMNMIELSLVRLELHLDTPIHSYFCERISFPHLQADVVHGNFLL